MFAYKSQGFNGAGLEADEGLQFLALAFMGGIGTISGAVIGGLLAPAGVLIVWLSSAQPSVNLFLGTGIGLIVIALWSPGGIAQLLSRAARRMGVPELSSLAPPEPAENELTGMDITT